MTDFKTIPLSAIHVDKNQPRKFFDDISLKELTESVKLKGVIQPIMVRANKTGYILVCGERRVKAANNAGLTEVPAVIRTLTDEEALEIQFIENIQREDVHPMDEATTFKAMIENKLHPYTIADIAAKINKPEKFVTHRLSLNNLIPELQDEFWKGKFLIGHAVLFSKLPPEDQKVCLKECEEHVYLAGNKALKQYKSIEEVKSFISRNIMRVLSSAPFKKDDPTLNPEMGPCTSCPYRSGNNPTLFDEVKETDRCFKPACFEKKISVHLVRAVKSILEEEPETVLLKLGYGTIDRPEIQKLIKDFNVRPLKEYDDFTSSVNKEDTKVKGIWIDGSGAGKIQYVGLKKQSKAAASVSSGGKPSASSIDMEIAGIKERTKRAAELDYEKVYATVTEILKASKEFISDKRDLRLTLEEITAAVVSLHEAGSMEFRKFIKKKLSLNVSDYHQVTTHDVEKLNASGLTEFGLHELIWHFILDKILLNNGGSYKTSGKALAIYNITKHYHPDEVNTAELEQEEKRTKREAKATQRIKALQDQKKEKPGVKSLIEPTLKKAAKKK